MQKLFLGTTQLPHLQFKVSNIIHSNTPSFCTTSLANATNREP